MKGRTIHITRKLEAPRELVFEAFSQPQHIGKWWGPNGFSSSTISMKFEAGGEWIFIMHGPDGIDYPNRVVYTEIKQPKLLKYDHFGYKDNINGPPHFKSTITFEDVNGKTTVNMTMLFPTAKQRDEATEYGAVEGGHQTLTRLADFIQEST